MLWTFLLQVVSDVPLTDEARAALTRHADCWRIRFSSPSTYRFGLAKRTADLSIEAGRVVAQLAYQCEERTAGSNSGSSDRDIMSRAIDHFDFGREFSILIDNKPQLLRRQGRGVSQAQLTQLDWGQFDEVGRLRPKPKLDLEPFEQERGIASVALSNDQLGLPTDVESYMFRYGADEFGSRLAILVAGSDLQGFSCRSIVISGAEGSSRLAGSVHRLGGEAWLINDGEEEHFDIPDTVEIELNKGDVSGTLSLQLTTQ